MAKKSKLNLINDDLTWNADRRYKVNSVVQLNGKDYQNITGKNSNPEFLIDWQKSASTTTIHKNGQLCVFKHPNNTNENILEAGDIVIGIVEGMFINASYLGGDTTLLASFDIVNQTEI